MLLYFLCMPLFHACCALFSFSVYNQSGFFLSVCLFCEADNFSDRALVEMTDRKMQECLSMRVFLQLLLACLPQKHQTHLLRCLCWPVTWWQWGRRWRWHSDRSWAWRGLTWFLGRMTHTALGSHHTFELHTFHCWSTAGEMRNM